MQLIHCPTLAVSELVGRLAASPASPLRAQLGDTSKMKGVLHRLRLPRVIEPLQSSPTRTVFKLTANNYVVKVTLLLATSSATVGVNQTGLEPVSLGPPSALCNRNQVGGNPQ